jgi:hypothetical protein
MKVIHEFKKSDVLYICFFLKTVFIQFFSIVSKRNMDVEVLLLGKDTEYEKGKKVIVIHYIVENALFYKINKKTNSSKNNEIKYEKLFCTEEEEGNFLILFEIQGVFSSKKILYEFSAFDSMIINNRELLLNQDKISFPKRDNFTQVAKIAKFKKEVELNKRQLFFVSDNIELIESSCRIQLQKFEASEYK